MTLSADNINELRSMAARIDEIADAYDPDSGNADDTERYFELGSLASGLRDVATDATAENERIAVFSKECNR